MKIQFTKTYFIYWKMCGIENVAS